MGKKVHGTSSIFVLFYTFSLGDREWSELEVAVRMMGVAQLVSGGVHVLILDAGMDGS